MYKLEDGKVRNRQVRRIQWRPAGLPLAFFQDRRKKTVWRRVETRTFDQVDDVITTLQKSFEFKYLQGHAAPLFFSVVFFPSPIPYIYIYIYTYINKNHKRRKGGQKIQTGD